ncbi:SDR family NAD(P)-dependent oxidoreductase [Caballeronia sp. LZ029]|uniref:NAD-dependent epimerase/dehydratase family protein n=1 Tax=Caballeronia sp. LZ029 TaxID=3038564 RepID=UPI0028641DA5|nr:SDR family NAD(P)-dependent oxidoreductase [Caballeronia sp. LZ029]MDR5746270.1 SDR family NAD(P)-dependent oxidoreductase [Caballeronia sp. LZ029]
MEQQNSTPSTGDAARFDRLLLTGAAGGIGRAIRHRVAEFAQHVRISDLPGVLPDDAAPHEERVPCDLADRQAVDALAADCDAIIHLGGVSVERPFEEILEANIKGVFNLYEAARRQGVGRIVFASSNHVTGFYRQDERIDATARKRPDGYYGLSKSFGEDMAQMYFDRYGIETVSIRIGSVFPEPKDRRMMASWMSYDDFHDLLRRSLFTKDVGHTIVFGMSANAHTWWDNRCAAHLGFVPRDSSEQFREKIEATPPPAPTDPVAVLQGGAFTTTGPFDPV